MRNPFLLLWGGLVLVSVIGIIVTHFKPLQQQTAVEPSVKLEKVKVQAGWLLNGEFANVCAAIVNGYYKDSGLDVEMIPSWSPDSKQIAFVSYRHLLPPAAKDKPTEK